MTSSLSIRVSSRRSADGHCEWIVGLWGEALGHILTVASGLTEDEAHARAVIEGAERGIEVRHDG